jgi:hypothetical protein
VSPDDLAARLLLALDRCDDVALASVLNPDVRMLVDTGDRAGGELRGRVPVTRALTELSVRHPDASLRAVQVNGASGIAVRRRDGEVLAVLGLDGTASIDVLWLSTAPGKLVHWNRGRPDT